MWFIALFLSISALALDPSERLQKVKILRILPGNVVLIERGLEDGINKNDHAKFSQEAEGYSARALCLKASATTSYWRLYRIPFAEMISRDLTYTLVGLADREIPFPEAALRDMDQNVVDPEADKSKEAPLGPDPFAITADLPERLTERDLLESVGPEKRKLFVEQALDKEQLKRDLKEYRVSVYASPFTRQSINEGESYRYGFRGGNIASKYRLLTQFEQQQTKLKDPMTKESVSTRSTSGQAQFIIHRLKPGMSSLSIVNYNSTRFGQLATPKSHWQVGPIGFTWHLLENGNWEYLDLSYVPLYDVRTTEILNPDGSTGIDRKNGFRHGFRLGMKRKINERVAFENLLWVRPYQNLGTFSIESDNLNLVNDLKLMFNLSENLYFDYNFIYQKDKLWRTLSGLPEVNVINSLNLRYDFNL